MLDRERTMTNEGGDGGRDECKASPPAIPLCHSESSRSVLSGSEHKDKNIKAKLDRADQSKNIHLLRVWEDKKLLLLRRQGEIVSSC